MSLSALLLVVLAACIHATWNLLAKRAASAGPSFVFAYALCATVIYLPLALWDVWRGGMVWSLPAVLVLVASAAIHLAYSLCLQRGYQVADLSVVYPVARGTGPLLSSIGAFVLLAEPPHTTAVMGMLCVVIGIFCIATQGRWARFRQPDAWVGVRWGAYTGALIACYTVVDAYGVKVLLVSPIVLDWFSNSLRTCMLTPYVLRRRQAAWTAMRGRWGLALAVGALSPLSYILVLQALSDGAPLSLVAPAREMSMMVGAVLGMVLLKEAAGVWRIAGCAVLVVGVVLLGMT
ncbi:putative membrane protein [plant metagenome]|uniref:Putative membrane protein n=1 Tax=plant metagenome TaxID=1297885 RepID=A0A484RLH4_9ZZZZ